MSGCGGDRRCKFLAEMVPTFLPRASKRRNRGRSSVHEVGGPRFQAARACAGTFAHPPLAAPRNSPPFQARTRPRLWGADIVRRFFYCISESRRQSTGGPLFRENGDASGPSCPVLVWGTQVSGGNTTISTSLTCMRFSANISLREESGVSIRDPRVSSISACKNAKQNEAASSRASDMEHNLRHVLL